ncbi:MAG: iron ABC transporter permease [Anaerolineales bacterium]|nr:iron ABC transporter permease [Anaerolineales bacterium]
MDRSGIEVSLVKRPVRSSSPLLTTALLWLAPLGFLALFYFYPLGSIFQVSFGRGETGWMGALLDTLASRSTYQVLSFTIWQAVLSTLLTLAIGLPGAYLFARFNFPGKSLLQALTTIPFVMPTLVVAAAFNSLLGPRGWLNLGLMQLFSLTEPPLVLTNSLAAILLAHVFYNTTIVLRMVGDFWSHIDPRLVQAAQVLGANRWRTFWQVTVPLLLPAISAAALLVFIFDFSSFGVILLLGGPRFATLEVEIYTQTISLFNLPVAASLAVIQLACTLGLTIAYTWLSNRISRPLSLRPKTYTKERLASWRARLFAGGILVLLLTLFILPLASLALRSVTHLESNRLDSQPIQRGLTLDFYRELSINRRQSMFYAPPTAAMGLSLGYASATVLLSLLLGLPAAWSLASAAQNPFNRLMDPLLMMPLGTSAVTLGLGFIVALDQPPLDLRNSWALIPLAHTLVAFPFVVRSLTPALRSIRPQLHHAAATLGASPGAVFRTIDLPLVGRSLLVAAVFAFTISLGEFGATSLIARPEYPTVPVAIYRFISQPGAMNYGQALALSTLLMLITSIGILLIERLRIAEVGEF